MIMTGHIVVGILGTAVFITWAPVLIKFMFIELQQNFLRLMWNRQRSFSF